MALQPLSAFLVQPTPPQLKGQGQGQAAGSLGTGSTGGKN